MLVHRPAGLASTPGLPGIRQAAIGVCHAEPEVAVRRRGLPAAAAKVPCTASYNTEQVGADLQAMRELRAQHR